MAAMGAYKRTIKVSKTTAQDLSIAIYFRVHHPNGYDVNRNNIYNEPTKNARPFVLAGVQEYLHLFFQYARSAIRIPAGRCGNANSTPFLTNAAKQSVCDAILANFNPNSDLIDFNRPCLHKLVDKAHLVNDPTEVIPASVTTELSLNRRASTRSSPPAG